jgi:calcium-dependent protein kinase
MFEGRNVDAKVKIIDFGFATRYDPSRGNLHKQVGTFDTMAPEVYGGNYTTQADLWSAGVVAFELISGKKPFAASSAAGVFSKVACGTFKYDMKAWSGKSLSSKTFVKDLIQRNPDQRLNATSALHHKWIRAYSEKQTSCFSKSMINIGDDMKLFSEAPTLKKIGLLMIAHKAFPEEISKLQKCFVSFDTANHGVITMEEFGNAISAMNEDYTYEEIQKIFNSIDTNGNGEIAYTEFLASTLEKYVHLSEDRILDAFDRIDVTNSGFISIEDLRLVLGRNFTEEMAKEIISQIDVDGDGKGMLCIVSLKIIKLMFPWKIEYGIFSHML